MTTNEPPVSGTIVRRNRVGCPCVAEDAQLNDVGNLIRGRDLPQL